MDGLRLAQDTIDTNILFLEVTHPSGRIEEGCDSAIGSGISSGVSLQA